jgi:hypothetical protein
VAGFIPTVLTSMLASRHWRHVTSYLPPVQIRIDDNRDVDSASLAHIQWHVIVPKQAHPDTYRPRIQISRWRAWIPGMRAKQIVWDLCLRI